MDIEFRPALHSDIVELQKLVNRSYRGESSKKGWTTEADLLGGQRVDYEGLAALMEAPQSLILCALSKPQNAEQKQILGCVHLKKDENSCYLGMLTVDPELQGSGIGKKLLHESESTARSWDCRKMFMTVIHMRHELIDWYKRHGYVITGETKPFPYGDPRFGLPKRSDLSFVVLEKNLY